MKEAKRKRPVVPASKEQQIMIRNRFHAVLLGAVTLITMPAVAVAAPSAARQWSVDKTDQISNETQYVLYNLGSQLGYENRTFGVDLGRGAKGGFFFFVRQSPSGKRDRRMGPIPEDANVAIFNTKTNRYLMFYARGDVKAELEWTNTPVYEWQIQDQSASGGRVHFALFNRRVKKYLVYKTQNYGINLGWLVAPTPPQPQSFSLAMTAQQITNGWVPYLGTFGKNLNGKVISVQNASQNATLMFVKPRQSTTNCSDPNATVRVAPRAMMTADQMKLLYGSATPRPPINFLACLTTPTPTQQSIGVTFLNITYKLDP